MVIKCSKRSIVNIERPVKVNYFFIILSLIVILEVFQLLEMKLHLEVNTI